MCGDKRVHDGSTGVAMATPSPLPLTNVLIQRLCETFGPARAKQGKGTVCTLCHYTENCYFRWYTHSGTMWRASKLESHELRSLSTLATIPIIQQHQVHNTNLRAAISEQACAPCSNSSIRHWERHAYWLLSVLVCICVSASPWVPALHILANSCLHPGTNETKNSGNCRSPQVKRRGKIRER